MKAWIRVSIASWEVQCYGIGPIASRDLYEEIAGPWDKQVEIIHDSSNYTVISRDFSIQYTRAVSPCLESQGKGIFEVV
jgi:hypothetical protein